MSYVEELIKDFGVNPVSDYKVETERDGRVVILRALEQPHIDISSGDPVLLLLQDNIGTEYNQGCTVESISVRHTSHNTRWRLYSFFRSVIIDVSTAKKPVQTKVYKDFADSRYSNSRKIEFLLRLYRHLKNNTITQETAVRCIKLFWNQRV